MGEKAKQILRLCTEPKKRSEIFEALKLANQTKNFKLHIQPLLESGYLELTIPDKPRSKNQKYRITENGLQLLQSQSNTKDPR
jgi:ATP-dependent DNA helicase RecG